MELFEDMFDAADALETVDTDVGRNLSSLVRNLKAVEQQIFDAEQHLKSLKREKERLEIESIPRASWKRWAWSAWT
jgi:chromosome segregation ATPase